MYTRQDALSRPRLILHRQVQLTRLAAACMAFVLELPVQTQLEISSQIGRAHV